MRLIIPSSRSPSIVASLAIRFLPLALVQRLCGAKILGDIRTNALAHVVDNGSLVNQSEQAFLRNHPSTGELTREDQAPFPASDVFGDSQIMRVQTESVHALRVSW